MSNCSPKKDRVEATATFTYTPAAVQEGLASQPVTLSFTYIDKFWHEIRPPSNTRKTLQNGQKKPKTRTTYIAVPSGETADGEVTFTNQEYIQQEYDYDPATGISKPVYERQCIAEISYDEKYFYHIIEWPTSHTMETRAVGGFTETSTTSTTSGDNGSVTTTISTYAVESSSVTANFSLAKVESEVVGLPDGSIAYHGATDDNKIFFTYSSNSDVVIGVGDVVNGWTVNKVVNYNTVYTGVDQTYYMTKKIRKRVSKTSKKNESPSFIYINNNSAGSSTAVVAVGDKVSGKDIENGTTVTAVDGNKITLSKPLKGRKIREALFKKNTVANKVNETTLCYAEISNGSSSFIADQAYTATGSGASIKVICGKGIINRSAVVGCYISKDKKEFRYTPLFYSKDNDCAPTITSDEYSEYVLGDIILSDSSELLSSKLLVTRPKTNLAYNINNIYWKNFNRPVDQDSLNKWISKFNNNIIELENTIVQHENAVLGSKKVSRAVDSECGNNLHQEYTKVYYPDQEIKAFNDAISTFQQEVTQDPCVEVKASDAYTKDEIANIITSNISGLTSLSSIRLPEEMYKQIVSNPDSLQNMLLNALDTIGASVPTSTTIPSLPPQIEGDNKSSQIFSTEEVTRVPPRMKSLEYLVDDLSFFSDVELTPSASGNIFSFTIKSIPRWTGTVSCSGVSGDDIQPPGTGLRIVINKTGGYVNSITASGVSFNANTSIENPLFPLNPTTTTKSWVGGSPYPATIWQGAGTNYQQEFEKTVEFRFNEVTEYVTESIRTKGSPFVDSPIYAQLTTALGNTDTTIKVNSTDGFLSSGYLIIPKFIIKQEKNPETKNINTNHYYLGEEIIYYRSKNSTQFLQCTRGMFDTTSTFEMSVNSGKIEKGVTYIIKTLGSVDWQSYGASSEAKVGTIFTAEKDGTQTTESGEVYLFESTLTPFDNAPDVNQVAHSYEKRGYLTQYWPIRVQNKTV